MEDDFEGREIVLKQSPVLTAMTAAKLTPFAEKAVHSNIMPRPI